MKTYPRLGFLVTYHTWGFPLDQACVEKGGLCGQGDLKVAVGVVVEHDVGSPDVVRGDVEHVHATVLIRVPTHLEIVPEQQTIYALWLNIVRVSLL